MIMVYLPPSTSRNVSTANSARAPLILKNTAYILYGQTVCVSYGTLALARGNLVFVFFTVLSHITRHATLTRI